MTIYTMNMEEDLNQEIEFMDSLPWNIEDEKKNIYKKYTTRISLPTNIDKIVSYGISNYEKLESIELPNNLKVIEPLAFENCLSLKEIIIPKSVNDIALSAFNNCKSLKRIIIFDENQKCLFRTDLLELVFIKKEEDIDYETIKKNINDFSKIYRKMYYGRWG